MEAVGPGRYRYTFETALPPDFDRNATHTLGAYVHREDRAFVDNPIAHFVPAGGPPAVTRDVVRTANCNECHDPIAAHGGVRREVGLCIRCHTDQGVDPETGNTYDFGPMIHRIHHGAELAKKPYLDAPTRAACGGCHDEVDFETGENHADGLALFDDIFSSACHRSSSVLPLRPEFDKSVPGAHVIPYESSKDPRLTLTIAGVRNMTPRGR